MEKITRRRLIKRATIGAGAAGAVAAAVAAGVHFVPGAGTQNTKQAANSTNDPIVVWIGNPADGTIVMMRGEQQTVVNNPAFIQSVLSL
jgi:Rieske Fe-S protein